MEQSTILWQGTTASDMEALTHPNHFVLDLRCPGVGRESDEQGEQDKSLCFILCCCFHVDLKVLDHNSHLYTLVYV